MRLGDLEKIADGFREYWPPKSSMTLRKINFDLRIKFSKSETVGDDAIYIFVDNKVTSRKEKAAIKKIISELGLEVRETVSDGSSDCLVGVSHVNCGSIWRVIERTMLEVVDVEPDDDVWVRVDNARRRRRSL